MNAIYLQFCLSLKDSYREGSGFFQKKLLKRIPSLLGVILLLLSTNILNAQERRAVVVPCIDGQSTEWGLAALIADPNYDHQTDVFSGNMDDIYTSSKDFKLFGDGGQPDYNNWTLSPMQPKSDIMNAAAVIMTGITSDLDCTSTFGNYDFTHTYLFFSGDRQSNNGDGQIGFWFLLNGTDAITNSDGDKVFLPAHSIGDLLVLANFEGGGRDAVVTVLQWVGPGNGTEGNNNSLVIVNNAAQVGQNNSGPTPIPSNFVVDGRTEYDTNEFYEGVIDLTSVFDLVSDPQLLCSTTWMLETRATKEITADLKDFVGGDFHLSPTVEVSDDEVCEGGVASLTATLSIGNPADFTFTWSGPGSFTGQGTATITFNPTALSDAGNYSVEVTSVITCEPEDDAIGILTVIPKTQTYMDSFTVCDGDSWSFSYDSDSDGNNESYGPYTVGVHTEDVVDSNGCPYQLEFTVNEYDVTDTYMDSFTVCDGDSWSFSYDSDGDGNNESYGPYTVGVHTEDVVDSNGCPYQLEFTVNEYDVTDTYMDSYTVCDGDSWSFSYDSDGDGNNESYGPYTVGIHTEDVLDSNGCPYQLEFTVNEYDVTDTYMDSFTVCDGDSWSFSYDSDGDGTNESYGPYTVGVHTEDVLDSSGCPYQLEFTVNEYDVTDTYMDSYTVCDGDSWSFSYDSDGDGNNESYGPYTVGVHTEDVLDSNGCPYQLEFTVNEYDVTDTYMDSFTVCDGDSWSFSYDSDGDGTNESYGPYTVGVHTEDVLDSNGCPYQLEFTVNEYDVTDTYMDSFTVCDGDSWSFSYDSDGDGTNESYGPYTVGVHTEDVLDSNGCPYQLEFTVNEYDVTDTYMDSFTVCDGDSWSFSYDSDGDGTNESYGPYTVGVHTEDVLDSNGCPYQLEFTVNEYDVTDTYMDSFTICDGDSWSFSYDSDGDGNNESYGPYTVGVHTEDVLDSNGCPYQLEFTVNEYDVTDTYMDSYTTCPGGSHTFSYDSDGDGNNESYGPYTVGVHTEDVVDSNGCPYQLEFTVNENPQAETYMDSFTVCDGDSWSFSYDSDGDGNNESYGPYTVGVHTEDVVDSNGCPYQLEFTVNENPQAETYMDSFTVCDGDSWSFSYDSDGDGNNESYGPYTVGVYAEDVVDSNGCPYQLEFTVNENPIPSCTTSTDSEFDRTCAGVTLQLHVEGMGGIGPYSYVWSGASAMYLDDVNSANPMLLNTAPIGFHDFTVTVYDEGASTRCYSTCVLQVEVYNCTPNCETGFAVKTENIDGYDTVDGDYSSCFRNDGFRRWGWVNTITEADMGTPVVFSLYAGAGRCDLSHGTFTGTVTVNYNFDGTVQVCYDLLDGYVMSEAHVYIGCEPYPTRNNGRYTVAPGQYSFNSGDLGYVQNSYCTPPISATGDFYVIAHAVVCELDVAPGCYLPGSPNEGGMFDELDPNESLPNCTVDTGGWGREASVDFTAYPVPFDNEVNIQYTFDYDTSVSIEVYDIKGIVVKRTVDAKYVTGTVGKTTINMSRLGSQLYYVRLTTNQGTVVKKIVSSGK